MLTLIYFNKTNTYVHTIKVKLSHRSLHFHLDKSIEFSCVFQWQFLHDRRDKSVHDHRHRLSFFESA